MSDIVEVETSEAEVTIAGMTTVPPTVTLVHEGRDGNRVRRSFVQQVPVRNADLADRIVSELHQGDRAQVTVVNEWRKDGCETYLADFKKVGIDHQDPVVKNGASSLVQNEITQIMIQPKQITTAKARK